MVTVKKGNIAFGQESLRGESTTTDNGGKYQLPLFMAANINYHCLWRQISTTCSNATEVAQWATPSCNRPEPDTDDGTRNGNNNNIIIYHDFLPTPRRGSHVKSGKTHTQSSRYTP